MMVGQLIDQLNEFRGRGDEVTVWDRATGEYAPVTGAKWNVNTKTVEITVGIPWYYPKMHVTTNEIWVNPICGVPGCGDSHPSSEYMCINGPDCMGNCCWGER